MRKIILLSFLLILFSSFASAGILYSHIDTPSSQTTWGVSSGSSYEWRECFEINENVTIDGVGFYVYSKVGTPNGNYWVEMTLNQTSLNSALVHANANTSHVGTSLTTSAWNYWNYTDFDLDAGEYCLAFRTDQALSGSNNIQFNFTDGKYPEGFFERSLNKIDWVNVLPGYDLIYILYGENRSNVSTFEITAQSYWDNTSLTSFSALINGTYYHTSNGTINTGILNSDMLLYNITVNRSLRFNVTELNYNTSNNYIAYMKASHINFSVYREFDGTKISNYNITIDGQNFSVDNDWYLIYPDVGIYSVTSIVDDNGIETYSVVNGSFNASPLDNKSVTFSVAGHIINIFAKNILTNASINTFNITLSGLNFTDERFNYTTTGQASFRANDGSFNLTVDSSEYALYNNTYTLNIDNTKEEWNYTFYLYTTNSVNITIYDSDTKVIMNGTNVTLSFIGASEVVDWTNNGTYYIDLLNPSSYTLTASADNYRQTSYIFTLVNRTYNEIILYMQKSNNSQLVLIEVKDKFSGQRIQNSLVTVQRWNDGWFTDQILETDFQGRTEGHFVLSTVYYNFLVEVNNITYFGVINSDENKKLIYAEDVNNGIVIEIDQNPNTVISEYQEVYGVDVNLTYINTSNETGYFRFYYDDINNLGRNAVLNVYKAGVLDCTQTSSTESGTIFCYVNITGDTGRILFVGKAYIDGILSDVDTGLLGSDDYHFNWGGIGYLFMFFIMIIGVIMFIDLPALSNFILLGIFGFAVMGEIIFPGINLSLISLIIGVGYVIFRIPTKGGINN